MMLVGKTGFFNSAGVSILGYGCGVSQYPQFYDQELKKYQVLTLPYLRYLEGCPKEKIHKIKMGVRLGRSSQNIFLGKYWKESNK